jgi:predicted DNA-binding ribbon-helix-helix protein
MSTHSLSSRQSAGTPYHGPDTGGRRTLSGLIKRSFSLAGHRTSVALEAAFWDFLNDAARARGMNLSRLVATVDAGRDGETPLASALRVLALRDALARAGTPGTDPCDGAAVASLQETSE